MAIAQILTADEIDDQLWGLYINYGLVNRKFTRGRLGLITSAIASELSQITNILGSYASQFSLDTCTDPALLASMLKPFTTKKLARQARVRITIGRNEGYNESVRIPAGFAISDASGSNVIFKTASDVYLWKGEAVTYVMAYCINTGSEYNVDAYTLTYFSNTEWNSKIYVVNEEPAFGGTDEEDLASMRARAGFFRYDRDGTYNNLKNLMFLNGLDENQYMFKEYGRGYGTAIIAIDADSNTEFEDLCVKIENMKPFGVRYYYEKATRRYVNFYVHIKTAGIIDYTETEKQNIYTIVQNTIQNVFAYNLSVGADLSVSRLVSLLNQKLSQNYEIYSCDVSFDDGIVLTNDNKIKVDTFERIYTNKIVTDLTYIG